MAMTNALMSLDLSEDPDTGQIVGANRRQVDTIYRAVSLCSSPSLIVGMDGTHDDIVTIDVFSSDNTPLLCWAFAVDHD